MEYIPLFFQGSSMAATGTPEMKEGRQSLQDVDVSGFSALLTSLLVPVQPLPDILATMAPQPEGTGQATASLLVVPPADFRTTPEKDASAADAITAVSTGMAVPVTGSREASPLRRSDSSTADPQVITAGTVGEMDRRPAENNGNANGLAVSDSARQVLPDTGVLLRLVPLNQGSAPEPRFRLEAVQQAGTVQGTDVKEMPVKVISVPPSAIDDGQITLPVQLPSGEQVTLVLRDMPDVASGPKGQGPANMAQSVKPAEPAEFLVGNSRSTAAPEAPRATTQAARQEQQAPASGGIIRIVLQVKPSNETTQQGPLQAATSGINRTVPLAKPSASRQENPAQALPVQSGTPAANAVRELPPTGSTVFSSQISETSRLRGAVENDGGAKGVAATAADQSVSVKTGTVPEIRVLNQSSRSVSVEVVVQQGSPTEVEGAQAAPQPSGRTVGEKTGSVEFDAVEAKLPGKPEKTALLADAVTGKEAVSAITTPAGSVDRVPDQPVQSTKEASVDTIIDQVMQKFSPANRHIPSEVTVKLQPEHLGNLQMKVSVDGDQVALRIHVESPMAKQMLENNLGQLRDSFGSLGLRMDSVSVSLGMNTGWERGHNPLWQEGRDHNAYNMRHNEPEPRLQEPPANLARAYPARVDRLLDMTI